jgi:hypothetical protein
MSTLQKTLLQMFDTAVIEGRERGMQVAVYRQGKLIGLTKNCFNSNGAEGSIFAAINRELGIGPEASK